MGCSNFTITNKDKETFSTKLPFSYYMSAHCGRVYGYIPVEEQNILDWLERGGDKSSPDKGLLKTRTSTHSATMTAGKIQEKKEGLLISLLRYILPNIFFNTHNWGLDIAAGGKGNKYESVDTTITDDGRSGHVLINTNIIKGGTVVGIGMEGTAPMKKGALGAHSLTGGADALTPFEGGKMWVKYQQKSNNMLMVLYACYHNNSTGFELLGSPKDFASFKQAITKIAPTKFDNLLKQADIKVYNHHGKKYIYGSIGKQMHDQGLMLPKPYDGMKVDILSITQIMQVKDVPDSIIYFKNTSNLASFLAQEVIFAKLEDKPALQEYHYQYDLEVCFNISALYDIHNAGNKAVSDAIKNIENSKADIKDIKSLKSVLGDGFTISLPSFSSEVSKDKYQDAIKDAINQQSYNNGQNHELINNAIQELDGQPIKEIQTQCSSLITNSLINNLTTRTP